MSLQPIARQSIPDEIFAQLAGQVLSGDRTPGETLPSERTLSEALGVSRAAVREALGRLDRARLIQVRQGESTVVRDFRAEAGFDVLPLLLVHGGDVDRDTLASVIEARAVIGPQVAALAAARVTDDARRRLRAAVDELAAEPDPLQRMWRALGFWEIIVEGAESIAFRLLFNTLRQVYIPALDVLVNVMAAEVGDIAHYRSLAEAIAAGDQDDSRRIAQQLLELGSAAFAELTAQLEGPR
ncbi:GntR family transcriptional regulator [Mycolicibacter engbaekii]|uniref:GntR family transcriptional regulator n=1 Tax=Mycolicibacter engbaekii TaxID=188915 RepID=A0A1X1TSV4_9MYCO|nr:GntR family transcriptional regulator [Mycolicibacter engbaekii]ORV47499.1 GntR family transcriptional regulator [Mycolicibacter engbaekii]